MQTMQAHVASSTRDFFAIDRYSGILHRKRLSDIRQDMLRWIHNLVSKKDAIKSYIFFSERYNSITIDTKMKGNSLSLEDIILMAS